MTSSRCEPPYRRPSSRSWMVNQSRLEIVVSWCVLEGYDTRQFGPDVLAHDFLKKLPHNDECNVFLKGNGSETYSTSVVSTSCHIADHFAITDTVPSLEGIVIKLRVDGSVISTFAPTLTAVDLLTSLPQNNGCGVDVFNFEGYLVGHTHFAMTFRCPNLPCGDTTRFKFRSKILNEQGMPRPSVRDPDACRVVKLLSYF